VSLAQLYFCRHANHPESIWEIVVADVPPPPSGNDPGSFAIRCVAGPQFDLDAGECRCWASALIPAGPPLKVLALMSRSQEEWDRSLFDLRVNLLALISRTQEE